MRKARIIAGYTLCIMFLLWITMSTMEVWIHNTDFAKGNNYSKANCWVIITSHTSEMKVTDCTKGNEDYLVTVEDIRGNQYDYYDTMQREMGTIMKITMYGNNIVDAKICKN